jgi:predicted transcriptional regulator
MNADCIQEIIDVLKCTRRQKKISQGELAIKLGIPQSHLSKIEGYKINPTLNLIVEIARALELEPMLIPKKHSRVICHLLESIDQPVLEASPAYTLSNGDEDE